REAETLAALNHPNIAQIYGLERSAAMPAIVMELVEGPTLADRIRTGPLSLDEALPIARQIADALDAAHGRGIVHRDLKPANVKVTDDGIVKVLDFGLAKAVEPPGEPTSEMANSPTLTAHPTQMGVVLGTAAYMAPEQATGKLVDRRADIWAFGCVLYEMLTGRRAFGGEDVSNTLVGVLGSSVDWTSLPAGTPPAIRTLLRRCLEKDRKRRLADAADARLEIDDALAAPADEPDASPAGQVTASRTSKWLAAAAGLVAGGLLAGLAVWRVPAPAAPLTRFLAAPASGGSIFIASTSPDVAISRDAAHMVVSFSPGGGELAVRARDSLEVTPLAGLRQAFGPFISPDGTWVGFHDYGDGFLKKVSILGGPTVTICEVGASGMRGASWAEDDTIVFGTIASSGLWQVPAGGGEPVEISRADPGTNHVWPEILPGEDAVLFTIASESGFDIALLDLERREHTILIPGGSYPRYAASGHIVYGVSGALRAVGFDLQRRRVTTSSIPVLDNVVTKSSGAADFALARDGSLVYIRGAAADAKRTLVWVDRDGQEEPIEAPPRPYSYPRISPDGSRVALDVRDLENDIWIWDLARERLARLTFDPGTDRTPVWTPTGDRIAFSSERNGGKANLFWQAADGTGTADRLTESVNQQIPMSFNHDGTELIFVENRATWDLMAVSLKDGNRVARPLVQTPFLDWGGEVSPNGRWIAYQSSESGRFDVYVRPFPDVDQGRWQVS
ncbi:MAG TPA: protein kinase, partial [Vicinamibacterales bacterium]|nr:protein kinase [Vicinamibacterales bacterium]